MADMTKGVEGALFVADEPGASDVERVLAAEVRNLRKRVNVLDVNWQGEQIARDEYMEEAQRLADAIERVRELCASRYELGHGGARLVGVDDVLAALRG